MVRSAVVVCALACVSMPALADTLIYQWSGTALHDDWMIGVVPTNGGGNSNAVYNPYTGAAGSYRWDIWLSGSANYSFNYESAFRTDDYCPPDAFHSDFYVCGGGGSTRLDPTTATLVAPGHWQFTAASSPYVVTYSPAGHPQKGVKDTPLGIIAQANAGFVGQTEWRMTLTQVDAVPEPATWTIMLGGFGLIGWRARGRRRLATASM